MPKYKVTRTTIISHVIEEAAGNHFPLEVALEKVMRYPYYATEVEDREIWTVEELEG